MRNPLSDVKLILDTFFGTKFQNTIDELTDTYNGRPLIDVIEAVNWMVSFKWIDKNVY